MVKPVTQGSNSTAHGYGGGGGASYDANGVGNAATLFTPWTLSGVSAPSTYSNGYNTGQGFAYILPLIGCNPVTGSTTTPVPTTPASTSTTPVPTTTTAAPTTTPGPPVRPSQLIWGNVTASNWTGLVNHIVTLGLAASQTTFTAVRNITYEGTLPSDPNYIISQASTSQIPNILLVAFCAKYGNAPNCTAAAIQGLFVWATTLVPSGDPIDGSLLFPWIQAYDLMRPILVGLLTPDNITTLDDFVYLLIDAGDAFVQNPQPNNHITYHYTLRALGAVVLADQGLINSTYQLVNEFVIYNIYDDGSTQDFYQRDAIYYVVYGLEAWMYMVLYTPQILSNTALTLINLAINWLQPYCLGTLTHIEFLHTTVTFDVRRMQDGLPIFQNLPWNYSEAFNLLDEAVLVFPNVAAWAIPKFAPPPSYSLTIVMQA